MVKVQVKVVYCGGWGYGARFRRLESQIIDNFDDDEVEITGESTQGITGFFEVSVNGKLVHSKKNGEGFVDSEAKFQKIVSAISDGLKA